MKHFKAKLLGFFFYLISNGKSSIKPAGYLTVDDLCDYCKENNTICEVCNEKWKEL